MTTTGTSDTTGVVDTVLTAPTRRYDGYIFDLDGTVYLGSELLPGARRLLEGLRERGARIVFLSNNPTRDPQMYIDKLTGLGIEVARHEILNTVVTMTTWLTDHAAGKKVFVIGEAPLKAAIGAAGLELTEDPADIDVVVASYDRSFDYRKLQIAYDALAFHKRAVLVTTNPDVFCPFPGGRGEPDAGAIVAAIEACTGVRCTVNAGKPDQLMVQTAMRQIGLEPDQCVMVGDRLSTDIAMGIAAGMDSALVLTGETTLPMLAASTVRPTWVLDRIDALLDAPA